MGCEKMPVDFGLRAEDSLGNPVNCDELDAGFGIEVPYMVETDQEVSLKFKGGASANWVLNTGDGEVKVSGETVEIKFPKAGLVEGFVKANNACNFEEEHRFRLSVITALGKPSLVINDGVPYTKNDTLSLSHVVSGAESMILTTDPSCNGDWETYDSGSVVDVINKNGANFVYAKFSNRLRESHCVGAGVIHDSIAPSVALSNIPMPLSNIKDLKVGVNANETGVGVESIECSFDGSSYQACAKHFEKANLSEGIHSLIVRATDKVGNISKPVKLDFELDHTAPVVKIVEAPSDYNKGGKLQYKISLADNRTEKPVLKCSINSIAIEKCTTNQEISVSSEGLNSFSVQAVDEVGNVSELQSHSFVVDRSGPVTTITDKPLDPSVEKTASFSFQSNDSGVNTVTQYCSIDGGVFKVCSSPVKYSSLNNGLRFFDVYAVDALGNRGNTARYTWEIDDGIVSEEILVTKPVKKVDILVVVDNSSSMKKEQKEMGKRFGNFVGSLSGLDWKLGIITTNADNDGPHSNGRLQNFKDDGSPQYSISEEDLDADTLFKNTIYRKEKGNDTEEAIKSVRKFLSRDDSKMLRDDAHFATIIVSDEDEKSRGSNIKGENDPEELIKSISSRFPSKVYTNHSIIWRPGDQNCARKGGKYEGKTYAKLTDMTDGILGDICSKNYTEQLEDIGDRIQETAFSVALKCIPRDLDGDGIGDVRVSITPKPSEEIGTKIRNNKLFFDPYPPEGSKVHLVYRCPTK